MAPCGCTSGWVSAARRRCSRRSSWRILDAAVPSIARLRSSFPRSEQAHMADILSHKLVNGMVVVGEPTRSVESAAFTFLTPSGCCYDPPQRAGVATLTSEMMLRGAGPRDSRTWVSDLENLGVE